MGIHRVLFLPLAPLPQIRPPTSNSTMPVKQPTKPAKRAHRVTDSSHDEDEPPMKKRKASEAQPESSKSSDNEDEE